MRQREELFDELPPPLASVWRKHFTSDHPRTGRPDDAACDLDCDRSTVYNLAKSTDTSARKIRRLLDRLGRDHPDLARDVFVALGFADAGYSIVRTGDLNRQREAKARAEAAPRDMPTVDTGATP